MPRGQSGQQLGGWSRIGFRWCRINSRKSRRNQRFDRRSCTWSAQQVKREKKSGQLSRLFGEKGKETGMDAQSRWRITQIHQRVQNQMRIQRGRLRSWSVGHVHWSSPVLGSRFFHTILSLNPATILGKNSKIWTAKSMSPTEKGREGLRFPLFCWQR